LAQLAVVLDDAVQDDCQLAPVAGGERVRVLLRHGAVRRPACMAEPRRRHRAVRTRCLDKVLQRADRAHVVETVLLAQRDAGRVVAAVLEPLQSLQEQRLRRPATDVSDDPAHLDLLDIAPETAKPGFTHRPFVGPGQPSSRRTSAAMLAQAPCAASSSSASASTRTRGSVPDGRTKTRPAPLHSSLSRATSSRIASVKSLSATRTFSLTCGKRGMTAATSLSGRPCSAPQRSSPAASPSPVTWSRSTMMWPDCSPPSTACSRFNASST